jgi:hypothetical protein
MAMSTLDTALRLALRCKEAAPHIVSRYNQKTIFWSISQQQGSTVGQAPVPAGFFTLKDYHRLWIGLWTAV